MNLFKTVAILFCFSFVSNMLYAQSQLEVTGQVKDAGTKEVLEFCSITAFNLKDSTSLKTATDDKGFFAMSLKRGVYRFVFYFVGYKQDTLTAVAVMENKFLGVIKLSPDAKMLNEVAIKTSSRQNLLDRDEQIVTDELRKGASNTKDVLDKLNGVEYDRYNNSIKVDNDAKVIILVDGLEKDQEYVKNLSPDRLKKVEIIRSPGGRYGLEGYSAVINIILKKDYQGTELLVNERAMIDLDASKNEYIPVQNNMSATFNYVYNKLNVYASSELNNNNFNLQSSNKKTYDNGLQIEKIYSDGKDMNTRVRELTNNYTLGADYYINPKHTISMENNVEVKPSKYNKTLQTYNNIYSMNGLVGGNFNSISKSISENVNSYNSLFYVWKYDESNTLNSNFTYSRYSNVYSSMYAESPSYYVNQSGTDNKNSTKFYAEYLHDFKYKTSVELGYGNTWGKQNNDYVTNSLPSNFMYEDIRHKFYGYYAWRKKKKISAKLGTASEASSLNANGRINSYFITQPYADVQYKPSEMFNMKLKYRSESKYPNISQTNPFTVPIDQQSISTGNPYLRPAVVHQISLQNHVMQGLFSVEPYYHFSANYIATIGTLLNNGLFEYSYSNVGYYKNYGFKSQLTIPFSKTLFLQSDVNVYKSSISYVGQVHKLGNWAMSSQFIYQNPKNEVLLLLKYQKNLIRQIISQGYEVNGNDYWIALIQRPFFKKKLNVMLLYFIPINWGVNFDQGKYIETNTYTESTANDIGFLKNMILLQIDFRFNKGKSVNKKEKKVEQNEEGKSKSVF